jgi:hypothetical protein
MRKAHPERHAQRAPLAHSAQRLAAVEVVLQPGAALDAAGLLRDHRPPRVFCRQLLQLAGVEDVPAQIAGRYTTDKDFDRVEIHNERRQSFSKRDRNQ